VHQCCSSPRAKIETGVRLESVDLRNVGGKIPSIRSKQNLDCSREVNGEYRELAPVIADLLGERMISGRLPSALEPSGIERPELNGASTVASDSSH
jgi:hypothetical protein